MPKHVLKQWLLVLAPQLQHGGDSTSRTTLAALITASPSREDITEFWQQAHMALIVYIANTLF